MDIASKEKARNIKRKKEMSIKKAGNTGQLNQ
jgi:hypothetical protein